MNHVQKIDLNNVIIVLADLQPEIILAANRTISEESLRKAVSVLIEGADILNIPVFLSGVPLKAGVSPNPIEELSKHTMVVRSTAGIFEDGSNLKIIKKYKRSSILLGGVATELAVIQAALGALRNGYNVFLLTDICGGLSDRTEQAAFRQLEKEGVILSSVPAFLSSLMPQINDLQTKSLFAALARFLG
ncbi:MAG: isochorismatase family protein [Sphingobacteriaceae bacterium]|nr:isochorismatase family protein [Sphingobacteriaceae bacterium]